MNTQKTFIILHDIRSEHNVGSIFRTADAVGVSKIYLTGYTPAPLDRFGRKENTIAKTALGAEENIPWEQGDVFEVIEMLKKQHTEIVSIEQSKSSIDYKNYSPKNDTAFILGDEVRGVSPDILEKSDVILEVPMIGKKESLNVSVTAGVVLFRVLNI